MRFPRWALLFSGCVLTLVLVGGCSQSRHSLSTDAAFADAVPSGSHIDGDAKWRDAGTAPEAPARRGAEADVAVHK